MSNCGYLANNKCYICKYITESIILYNIFIYIAIHIPNSFLGILLEIMKKILLFSALLGFGCYWSGVALHSTLTNYIQSPLESTIAYSPSDQTYESVPYDNIHINHKSEGEFVDPTTLVTTPVPTDSEITSKRRDTINTYLNSRRAKMNSGSAPTQIPTPATTTTPKPVPTVPTATTTVPKPTPLPAAPVVAKPIKWGVFAGSNPTVIADFEKRVSENPDYLAFFVHWGNGGGALPTFLSDYAYKKDRTLVLFWEASDYKIGGTVQPDYSYQSILNGKWDTYFKDFAKQLTAYQGPIILVPFSELNGNWNPWSGTTNGNKPQDAVVAWRYIHKFFADVPNVKFGLAVNAASVPNTPENQIINYYPGDEYVDYVGVDGFNMGNPNLSFDALFNKPLNIFKQYNKPVLIFSFGTGASPDKAAWLNDALNVQLPKYPFVTGWVYFNQNKERNWLLWSDQNTFSVFTKYITQ